MGTGAKGNSNLRYTAQLSVKEAIANAKLLKKELGTLGIDVSKAFDSKPMTGFQSAQLALKKTLIDAQIESEKLRKENLALAQSYKEGQISAQQLAAAERKNKADRQELIRSTNIARQSQVAANGSYDEASKALIRLGRSIKSAEGGFNSTNPIIRAQISEYQRLNKSLKEFDSQMGNNQRKVGDYSGALSGVVGRLSGLAAGFLSAGALLQSAFSTALSTDAIKTSLEFTFNSVDVAKGKLTDLRNTANRLGLEYTSLADSYRSFAGAAVASNFPLKETDRIFNSVANAGAKLKLSSDQVTGALTALQQMISKGTVQSEELRGQLGERLPGAFAIAARAMGVTQQELGKLLKDGKILASDLLPKLADELDNTFSNDKNEKVKSLQGSVNELKNSFTGIVETKGAISSFFTFVVDAAGGVVKGIGKMSEALGIFYELASNPRKFIGDSAKASRSDSMNSLIESAQQTAKGKAATSGGKSQLYNSLNEEKKLLIQVQAEYSRLNADYQKIKPGDRNIADTKKLQDQEKSLQFQIQYVRALSGEFDRLYMVKKKGEETADSDLKSIKAIRDRINELKKLDGSAIIGDDVYNRIQALQERLKKPSSSAAGINSGISSRNALQREIDDAIAASKRKQLSADDADVQAVEDKYAKIREKVKQHYEKLAKQEKSGKQDPTKKENLNVRLSGLDTAEINEKQAVIDKQSNDRFKIQLSEQAKDFEEFENYKLKFGTEAAQKRYNVDYTTAEAYAQKLEDLQTNILNKYGDPSGYTEAQRQELGIVTDQIIAFNNQRKSLNDKYYDDAVQAAMTAAQAIKAIDNDYQRDLKALGDTATDEQKAMLNRRKDDAIKSVNETALEIKIGWEHLFDNYDRMSRKAILDNLRTQKQAIQEALDTGDIDPKAGADKINAIDNAIDNLSANEGFNRVEGAIKKWRIAVEKFGKSSEQAKGAFRVLILESSVLANKLVGDIESIGSSLQDAGIGGEGLQRVFKNVVGIVGGAAQIAQGIATGNPIGIVAGSIKLLSSAIDLFNSKDRKLNRQIEVYKEQLDSLGKAYAKLERDVNNSVGESYYTDSAKQIENLKQQEAELIKARDAEASKKKSDKSKVQEYNNAIAEIPNKIEDINRAVSQMLLQSNFKEFSQNLSDALVSAFEAGESGIDAMNDTFDNFIKKAVANSIQLKVIQPIIDDMMKEAGDYAKGNDNSILGFDFNKWRELLAGVTNKSTQLLEEAYKGLGLEKGEGPKTSLKAEISEKLTEATGTELTGIMRGQYDLTKQIVVLNTERNTLLLPISKGIGDFLSIARSNLDVAIKNERNTFRIAENTEGMGTKLDKIISNTSSQSSRSLLG
ncbi:tape measure protein [Pedobacter antarcticus]|uniref:tape measure protein n=1 Tax=Pedobacter antarcticus TaxID=34086 RepID=UPI00292DC5E5|nr:tape measure protein [Pedobacter antarcticus]